MDPFEFVFSLFGLLLGLSLVEVLSGLIRTVRARQHTRLGVLTPLLGVFVMFHITSFWSACWDMRERFVVNDGILFSGLILTALYYYAASLVFPAKPEEWPDLDDYFFKYKRQVLAGVLTCDVIVLTFRKFEDSADFGPYATGLLFAAIFSGIAIFARSKKVNIAILLLLLVPLLLNAVLGPSDTYFDRPPASQISGST